METEGEQLTTLTVGILLMKRYNKKMKSDLAAWVGISRWKGITGAKIIQVIA